MESGNAITQIFLPLSLAFIMFSVGLEPTIADFKRVAVQPKDFLVGALSQVVLLPLVAFALLSFWAIEPALAVGVMIIAACPGGLTSNLMTYLARGDTALSVSLTAVISVLAVVTLPLIVSFAILHFMDTAPAPELSIGRTVIGVFAITTVPVSFSSVSAIIYSQKKIWPGISDRSWRPLGHAIVRFMQPLSLGTATAYNVGFRVFGGTYHRCADPDAGSGQGAAVKWGR